MQHPAWLLVIIGLLIAAIGAMWLLLPSVPWLGKLPGDDVHPAQFAANGYHVAGAIFFTLTKIVAPLLP